MRTPSTDFLRCSCGLVLHVRNGHALCLDCKVVHQVTITTQSTAPAAQLETPEEPTITTKEGLR